MVLYLQGIDPSVLNQACIGVNGRQDKRAISKKAHLYGKYTDTI